MATTVGRRRALLPLLAWCLTLVAGVWLFTAMGDGPLQAPPLDPSGWSAWAQGRDPLVATVAVLRLVALALSWYLVGVTTIGIVARVARAAALVRVADALTVPMVRRLLQGALGLSLATAVVTASVPAGPGTGASAGPGGAPTSSVTLRVADDGGDLEPDRSDREDPGGPGPVTLTRATSDHGERDPEPSAAPRLRRAGPDADTDGAAGPAGTPTLRRAGTDAGRAGDGPPAVSPVADREADDPAPDEVPTLRRATPVPLEVAARGAAGAEVHDARAEHDAADLDAADHGSGDDVDAGASDETAGSASDADGRLPHRVRSGESLWSIASDTLTAAFEQPPGDADLRRYWHRVVEENRPRLADPDNPDLIFPGDELVLPPVPDDRSAR